MLVGYMRVSKADGSQALDLQRDALIAAGVGPGAIYEDRASGAKEDRPGLSACLKALRQNDVLVIWKLDRLGRNLKHLIETVEDLTKRGVGFKVLQGAPVDTTTSQGKLMFTMFAALAEFERDVIRERTLAGLASARARGRKGGAETDFDRIAAAQGASSDGKPGHARSGSVRRAQDQPGNPLQSRDPRWEAYVPWRSALAEAIAPVV